MLHLATQYTSTFALLLLLGCIHLSFAHPSNPAAVAADPAAASAAPVDVVAAPAPPPQESPVAPSTVAADPTATKILPPPVSPPAQQLGGGIVTEHKNPDGSVITVTRYNGPLPANAFQNPLMTSGLFTGLHDNLYQTQLLQLQALRNLQLYNYYPLFYPPTTPHYPIYRSNYPYVYTTSGNPFFSPFFGYGGGYPFGGYPGVYGKSV